MRINVCDMDTGGDVSTVETTASTVGQYFTQHKAGRSMNDYMVKLNGQVANAGTYLTPGAQLIITRSKLAAAKPKPKGRPKPGALIAA